MFEGRQLFIATMHGKEQVIAPRVEHGLGVHCFTSSALNTDIFGTFSGEVERVHDPISTLRNKCNHALDMASCDLVIASEGSFEPHPSLFFIPCADELLMFMDRKHKLEIVVRQVNTITNFSAETVQLEAELVDFASRAQFPAHGLILRKGSDDMSMMTKGITDWNTLKSTFHTILNQSDSVFVETDMRAMYNPTRMQHIANLTDQLIVKLLSCCLSCQTPGFGITDSTPGLPCEICDFPTSSTLSYTYTCQRCHFSQVENAPRAKENPMYCDQCNP